MGGNFCINCGRSNIQLFKGLCRECFLKEYKLLEVPERIEVEVCAHCNAQLINGKWTGRGVPEDEIIYHALENNISRSVEDTIVDLEIIQKRGTISSCLVRGEAKVLGERITQDFYTEVRLKKRVCPYCSKYKSGYYEAVIQLRADERSLGSGEIEKAEQVINKTLQRLWEKDKLAYLARTTRQREGVDYYIGSYKAAKRVVAALREEFGGIVKESPRLMGRDKSTGKNIYRIWISFKLPKFKKGDFISYKGHIGVIKAMDSHGILFYDLDRREMSTTLWREYQNIERIATPEDIKETTVTAISPGRIQILDPISYEPIDLKLKPGMENLKIGDQVSVIQIDNKTYILW
ncbi:MAG TPA: 60S ribosomal export protein NMD3 [Methanothermobacter sp.]|nr:60S ribosomal export protein NMD3 [Methanothermobacter sp.]